MIAYETMPRKIQMEDEFHNPEYYSGLRLVSICPIRQGFLEFSVSYAYVGRHIIQGMGMGTRFYIYPDTCGVSDWYFIPHSQITDLRPGVAITLLTMRCETAQNMPKPPDVERFPIGDLYHLKYFPTAGILPLGVPELSLDSIVQLLARPGFDISMPIGLKLGEAGGSATLKLLNAVKDITLNPNELAKIDSEVTMPALLPGQTFPFDLASEIKLCNIASLFSTQEAIDAIKQSLAELGFPKSLSKKLEINPTDCILADIKGGRVDILGQDIDYSGMIWTEGGLPQPISGKAPQSLNFSEKLLYLKIEPSRELAICEGGSLLSKASKVYEYSNLPFPLPIKAGQRVMTAFSLLMPASDLKPRFMSKSRMRVREVVSV